MSYCKQIDTIAHWLKAKTYLKEHDYTDGSINKENPLDLRIDILDEDFLQPYDYQTILKKNPENEVALEVEVNVEKYMKYLQNCGVLSGHIEGEYI